MEGVLEASDDLYFHQNSSRFPEIEDIRQRMGKAWGLGCKKYIEDGGFIYDKMFLLSDQTSDVVKFITLSVTYSVYGSNTESCSFIATVCVAYSNIARSLLLSPNTYI